MLLPAASPPEACSYLSCYRKPFPTKFHVVTSNATHSHPIYVCSPSSQVHSRPIPTIFMKTHFTSLLHSTHPLVDILYASSNPSRIPSTTALSSHPAELLLLLRIFNPRSTSNNLVCAHVRKLASRRTSSQLSSSVNVVFIS